ncbi:MAG: ASKHA domain-containing protein [Acetatifactor sp.]
MKKGLRCRVCTGCGLCPGVLRPEVKEQKIHVLADLPGEGQGELPFADGTRLAVADIGTTTIAMLLYDMEGRVEARYVTVNPQVKYGADVISRIRAAEEPQCAGDLRDLVRKELEKGLNRFRDILSAGERLQLVIAANTTMIYLMMGWDTSELGRAPFHATRLGTVETTLGEVPCFVMPGMSAFVGGDITSGMYACGMDKEEEITLFIDLGTNGELALGNKNKRIACATAAGPAFEGGVNRGIWGADMISLLAALRREKLLDETGLLEEKYFESGVRAGNVLITGSAVRSVQLAKAAIAAGIKTLLDRYGIKGEDVDRVVLAGGFGYYLNPADAAEIGLLPKTLAAKAYAGGNTALMGALKAGRMLLKDKGDLELQQRLKKLVEGTECINLAEEPGFNECYLSSMNLEEYE